MLDDFREAPTAIVWWLFLAVVAVYSILQVSYRREVGAIVLGVVILKVARRIM